VTGEQLLNDVMVNELPTTITKDTSADNSSSNTGPVIDGALLAQIEMLEAEHKKLKVRLNIARKHLGCKISSVTIDLSAVFVI